MQPSFLAAAVVVAASFASAAERPNIVFIYTDDQAAWALGAAGHPHAQTPHLDRLAKEGAMLVNAFTTTPVCSPSRAGLMVSRYGTELGITDWIEPKSESTLGLAPATVTWPERLQQAGYATGLVGKWHLGLPDQFHPTKTGYDFFFGFRGGGSTPKNPVLELDGREQKFDGFTPDLLTDRAIRFLEQRRADTAKPFLLNLHFRAPHAPWLPVADADWEPFASLDPQVPNPDFPHLDVPRVKKVTREYLASVHSVDRNVGRLLAWLDEHGQSRNTLVVFTSDHGYNIGHHGVLHKGNAAWILTETPAATKNVPKGQRPNLFDTSLRVPALVRWPSVIPAGSRIQETATNLDWYPTLLAAAGVDLPSEPIVRGRNLLPLLRGERPAWDNDLHVEYSQHHSARTHLRAYRTPKWKLIRDFLNPGRDELYHLATDPDETRNRIADESPDVRQIVAELHDKLVQRMHAIGDRVDQQP